MHACCGHAACTAKIHARALRGIQVFASAQCYPVLLLRDQGHSWWRCVGMCMCVCVFVLLTLLAFLLQDQGAMTSPTGGRLSHLLTPHDMLKDNPYTHTDTTTKHMYMDDKDTHMQIPAYQYDNAATQYRSSGGGARMYDDTAVMAHIATPRSGSPRQLQPQPQLERQQRQLSAPEAAAAAAAAVTGVAARVSQRWWTPAGQQHDNNGVGVMHGGGSPYQPSR